jgi:predicted nucleotidyltransferase
MVSRKKTRMNAHERLKRLKRSFGALKGEPLDYSEIKKSRRDIRIGWFPSHMAGFPTFINNACHNESMFGPEFKLLVAFLHSPSKELYARQIERMTATNHERAGVYLAKLVAQKALLREKKGKQVFYRINRQNELAQKALAFAELERRIDFVKGNTEGFIVQDLVMQLIRECRPSIYFILLFGSVARGHQREGSDIDLLFVLLGNGKTKAKIEGLIKKQEMLTGKKISFHPVTIKELEKLWSEEPVYKNIWDERVVFFGEENFWSFVLKEGEPHARQIG